LRTNQLLPKPTPVETGWDAVPDVEQRSSTRVGVVRVVGLMGVSSAVGGVSDWTAGRVSDSPESGLSGCLSYCSVLLLDLVGRPVPQGGVESFLIVCSSSIQEAISRMALLLVGYTI